MANEATKFTINGVQHDVMDVGARQLIASVQAALNAITSGDTTTAIKTFQEVIDFLDGVTDDATLVGKLNELRTLINGKYAKPANGIPSSDLVQSVQDILSDVANKVDKVNGKGLSTNDFTTALLEKLSALPDAEQYEEDIADAGKVKTVSVNNGTPATPDQNGNVNINVQSGAQGNDGITPHIDALTGNWFIGETDTHVKAQGEQGNSGVSSADEVAVVNNLDGEPDNLESGKVAVLSAGMGKFIGDRCIPLSGTFADAYDKAKVLNAVFPWMLIDEDEDGNPVKKMMWHVGNKEFVDAIGGKVDGVKNGVTIVTDTPGYMRIWDTVQYKLQTSKIYDYELHVGENNFSFDDIGGNRHVYVEFIKSDKSGLMTNATMSIDFGGMTISTSYSSDSSQSSGEFSRLPNLFSGMTNVKSIKRLNINPTSGGNGNLLGWFKANTKLETLQIGGTVTTGTMRNWLQQSESLIKLDLSGLSAPIASFRTGFNFILSNKLEYIDIRGFDFSGATSIASFLSFDAANVVNTVVVGNIDTSSVSSSSGFCSNITNATLVCTQDTPPAWGVDIISGHFTSIKVPNKTVDVEGTPTAVIDLYKAATGWSTYEGIMSTYEEGEY